MELRHLLAFAVVAELRHFGRAAERLGISQPPLSRQIQQLEADLGMPLFIRHSRLVELTPEGAKYLRAVQPHLDGLQRARDQARAHCRQRRGKVKVGFVSSLAYGLIPRALETLRTAAPGIEVEMFEQSSATQCQGVREHRLDLGLVFLPVEAQELKMRFLFREPLVTMLPAKHALAASRSVALERLHQEPFIMCSHQPQAGFRETVLGLCRANGFEPQVAHSASSTAAMAELVATGFGVALVPRSAADHKSVGVAYRPLAKTPLQLETAAVWRAEAMSPLLRLFLDHAIMAARQPKR